MLQLLSLRLLLQEKREFIWKAARIQAIIAPLAQLLTFTAFGDDSCSGSNVKCVPGAAGIIAIFNIFILIALACVCWFAAPLEQPLFEIKRLETPTSPEQKPTTVEDMEMWKLNRSTEVCTGTRMIVLTRQLLKNLTKWSSPSRLMQNSRFDL
jgi:hypothetical protein